MQTFTIKINDEHVDFFLQLLKRLNFILEISNTKVKKKEVVQESSLASVRIPTGKPSIKDFAGLWSDNPKTLKQIREKAWKRS